jgi:hypothetical protein
VEITRTQRVALIERELEVGASDPSGGLRPITHRGVEVGLLGRGSNGWTLVSKVRADHPWREDPVRLREAPPEVAEAWAVHELATLLAMLEEARLKEGRGT